MLRKTACIKQKRSVEILGLKTGRDDVRNAGEGCWAHIQKWAGWKGDMCIMCCCYICIHEAEMSVDCRSARPALCWLVVLGPAAYCRLCCQAEFCCWHGGYLEPRWLLLLLWLHWLPRFPGVPGPLLPPAALLSSCRGGDPSWLASGQAARIGEGGREQGENHGLHQGQLQEGEGVWRGERG